jgi:hypothetical protein
MNTLKVIDENTLLVEGVYYTTQILKKTEIYGKSGYKIDSVVYKGTYYYPFKTETQKS